MRQTARVIILLIAMVALLESSCAKADNQPAPPPPPLSTEPLSAPVPAPVAPPEDSKPLKFPFTDVKGRQFHPEDLRGKVVLVVYWATWCPPCRREIPALNELHTTYSARGLQILAISQDDELSTLQDFLIKDEVGRSIRYTVIYGRTYINYFGYAEALPTMVLIDKAGKVIGRQEGAVPGELLAKAIEKHL